MVRLIGLSPKELEIAVLVAKGFSGAEIQGHLNLARSTFQTHKRNLYHKLGVSCRERLVIKLVMLTAPLLDETVFDEFHED